jgi:hypothetical protein
MKSLDRNTTGRPACRQAAVRITLPKRGDFLGELIWINASWWRDPLRSNRQFLGRLKPGVRDHASRLVLASRDSVGGARGARLRGVPRRVPSGK